MKDYLIQRFEWKIMNYFFKQINIIALLYKNYIEIILIFTYYNIFFNSQIHIKITI